METKSDKKRILKNSIIVTSTTIIEKMFFFIINVLVARYLSIGQYGEYTTALEFATFFSIFTNLGINQALIRAVNIESQYEKEHFTNNLFIKTFLAIIIFIILSISLYFSNYNANTVFLTLIFGFVRIANEFLTSFYAINEAKEDFNIQSILTILFSFSFLSSTVIIILLKANYFYFAYTRFFLVIVFLVIIVIHTVKYLKFKFNYLTLQRFIKNTIPFTFSIIYTNLIQRANILILSLIHGTIFTGVFNNSYYFFISLQFIPHNIQRVLIPYLYKFPYKKNREKFQFAFDVFSKLLSIISFYIFIILFLYSNVIIISIYKEKYSDSIIILKTLAFGIPFLFTIAPVIITTLDKQKVVSYITGCSAVINLISNFVLIYLYKSEGAAIATVITFISTFFLSHMYLKIKKYIYIKKTLTTYFKLLIITGGLYLINILLLNNIYYYFSFAIVSSLFFLATYLFIIENDDIRILKETLGIKSKV